MSLPGAMKAPEATSVPPPPKAPLARLLAYRLFWSVALATYLADRATKLWVMSRMAKGTYYEADGSIPVVRGFFYLVHVGNTGAAWSLFSGQSIALALLALATLAAIYIWRKVLGLHTRSGQLCFGLLCGGIVGNLYDRLRYQYVIDFIDLHFGSYVYPTFNVADSGICVGVVVYVFLNLFPRDKA